ncbi:30S ribosomal protein S9 [Staphylococcus aureus]
MKRAVLLTRAPRRKERKEPGLKAARQYPQFSNG